MIKLKNDPLFPKQMGNKCWTACGHRAASRSPSAPPPPPRPSAVTRTGPRPAPRPERLGAVSDLQPAAAGGPRASEYSHVMLYRLALSTSMNEGGNWLPRKPSSPGNYYCNRLHTPPITEMNNNLRPLTGSFRSEPLLSTATYWRAETH